jgi:ribosomal protein S18 acetylase RimI-like enzyme
LHAPLSITRATVADVPHVAPLFDLYRQFYGQAPDAARAEAFIRERLESGESVIFLARRADGAGTAEPAGLTQLYPLFSSVRAVRTWLLNDLFVHPDHRRAGVARALMLRAIEHCRETGRAGLELATADDNVQAQALYEDLGFVRERGYRHYALTISPP